MASTPLKRGTTAPVITTGAVTSPSSTQVGDLLIFVGWTQGAAFASIVHTIQSGFTSVHVNTLDDGTDDGRFTIALKEATQAGAQSYTPWAISGGNANQTTIGVYVVQAGTWAKSILTSFPAANVSSAPSTTNAVPNSPQLTPTFGLDYIFLSIGAWHITTAGTTDAGAPTSYTMACENDPAVSHVTHLAIAERTLTNLQAAENPAGFTDNVAPNGTISCTICIPGPATLQGAAVVSGAGALAAAGGIQRAGSSTMGGIGSIAAAGIISRPGAAALGGAGSLTADGTVIGGGIQGAATLAGSSSLAAAGTVIKQGAASLTGAGALAAAGNLIKAGGSSFGGIGSMFASGSIRRPGVAALGGAGGLSASGTIIGGTQQGSAALAGSSSLVAQGRVIKQGSASVGGAGALAAAGELAVVGGAQLGAAGSLRAGALLWHRRRHDELVV